MNPTRGVGQGRPVPHPAYEPCGSALESRLTSSLRSERVGTGSTSHNGPIMRTLSLSSAHPHGLQPSASGSRTRHMLRASGHPSGFDRKAFCPLASRSRDRGSSVDTNVIDESKDAPPLPPRFARPQWKGLLAMPVFPFQVFRGIPTSQSGLAHLPAGEPPYPVPLGSPASSFRPFASSGSSASSVRPTLPP